MSCLEHDVKQSSVHSLHPFDAIMQQKEHNNSNHEKWGESALFSCYECDCGNNISLIFQLRAIPLIFLIFWATKKENTNFSPILQKAYSHNHSFGTFAKLMLMLLWLFRMVESKLNEWLIYRIVIFHYHNQRHTNTLIIIFH